MRLWRELMDSKGLDHGNRPRRADEVWDLLPTTGDERARAVMQRYPNLVSEVAGIGQPFDLDAVEDLLRWN